MDTTLFRVQTQIFGHGKNAHITIVYKPLTSQSGLYMGSAPVEEKGYMNFIITFNIKINNCS
jgi:hypothetical protein